MKKKFFLVAGIAFICSCFGTVRSQSIGIGTSAPDNTAMLDIKSSTKGMLIPRTSTVSRLAILNPAKGLILYDTITSSFWFHNGSAWAEISAAANAWSLAGNVGTNPATQFIGTTDIANLRFKINNANAGLLTNNGNIFWGLRSGNSITNGYSNIAIGTDALKSNTANLNIVAIGDSALFNNGTGANAALFEGGGNTAIGSKSLYANTKGFANTATGYSALISNTTGNNNTANGYFALNNNTVGINNVAIGLAALNHNINGNENTAIGNYTLAGQSFTNGGVPWQSANTAMGYNALNFNFNGTFNTAIGHTALTSNSSGSFNTATGASALANNTTGSFNTANGYSALGFNSSGVSNTANGYAALYNNTTGGENTAIGTAALYTQSFSNGGTAYVSGNVAVGFEALYLNNPSSIFNGSQNTAIGHSTLRANTTGAFNTACGSYALYSNISGNYNTSAGDNALYSNSTGDLNTAYGSNALAFNTAASRNTAIGSNALYNQSYSNGGISWVSENVAVGYNALYLNQPASLDDGVRNTAIGSYALQANTTGKYNTALGHTSLVQNNTGQGNTASGWEALYSNNSGNFNTASGWRALHSNTSGSSNIAIGREALDNNIGGSYNIAIGYGSGNLGPNLNNTVGIGNDGFLPGVSNQVILGNASTTFIGGAVAFITTSSDARIKNTILEDVKGLDFILRLRPVTYHINLKAITTITGNKETPDFPEKYDGEKIKYSGFLAQEVEDAAKTAGYDFNGVYVPNKTTELYGLRYSEFVVPLVKAMQEQQSMIDSLQRELSIVKKANLTQTEKQELIILQLQQQAALLEKRLAAVEAKQ